MDENRMYTTVQGDMWDYIAWKFYDDEKYVSLLFSENPELLEISVFSAGTKVYIPELPEDLDKDMPEWRLEDES